MKPAGTQDQHSTSGGSGVVISVPGVLAEQQGCGGAKDCPKP
jgi:hypothetical protein